MEDTRQFVTTTTTIQKISGLVSGLAWVEVSSVAALVSMF